MMKVNYHCGVVGKFLPKEELSKNPLSLDVEFVMSSKEKRLLVRSTK